MSLDCNPIIDSFQREIGDLDVSDKYLQLMRDSVSEDSLYIRAKDTMKVLFDDLQISEQEKAKLVSEFISSLTVNLSTSSMQTALSWAKEERDGAYLLAKTAAEVELVYANTLKAKEEICLVAKQTEQVCADIEATIAGSIRDNGKPTGYDGCKPTGLEDSGLKYEQTKQVEGATYQIYADAFRKSGVVQIGTDVADSTVKGLSGDDYGYTNQQSKNAERQRIAYEDSKRNHVVNSSAAMVGQLIAADQGNYAGPLAQWEEAASYLNDDYITTPTK